jgi:predicted N-acetyltransferase YhbS
MNTEAEMQEAGTLETDHVEVRNLTRDDLETLVKIDQKVFGQNRREYYRLKLKENLEESSIQVSLLALVEGLPVGFLMASLYYGEFGQVEAAAILDSIGVDPDYHGQKIGRALMRQLKMNLKALNIKTIQTQVDWDQFDLLQFFAREGFQPSRRICLEVGL